MEFVIKLSEVIDRGKSSSDGSGVNQDFNGSLYKKWH